MLEAFLSALVFLVVVQFIFKHDDFFVGAFLVLAVAVFGCAAYSGAISQETVILICVCVFVGAVFFGGPFFPKRRRGSR